MSVCYKLKWKRIGWQSCMDPRGKGDIYALEDKVIDMHED